MAAIPPAGQLEREKASFRDPDGFVFVRDGVLYRQINQSGRADYDLLMSSGLYQELIKNRQLVAHTEVDVPAAAPELAYQVIRPEPVAFISYPYEWSFSQLKDAALLTLAVQKTALEHGMILKDASAYNVQFLRGQPVLIDTLSFTRYEPGTPWIGYRQYCQHFLAPLALMSLKDVRLAQLLRVYLDGIPLDLASELLPVRTRLPGGLYLHIHLHAQAQRKYAGQAVSAEGGRQISRMQLQGLIESLEKNVTKLEWTPAGTSWADYDRQHNYTDQALLAKQEIVHSCLSSASPEVVWDLGANTGLFSRIAAEKARQVIAFDFDPGAVELGYLHNREEGSQKILTLLLDLTNPSPGIGWRNAERQSLEARTQADLIMALALVHHLAIANNLPLVEIAEFFAALGEWLVVEFVPKSDSQVQLLLASRKDIFPDYEEAGFEQAFLKVFDLVQKERVPESERIIYLMRRKSG
ncbi:MAG: class I SAM-dependent methyltransferase [Anaerolineales bacterium]|jgi:hypothetical protein